MVVVVLLQAMVVQVAVLHSTLPQQTTGLLFLLGKVTTAGLEMPLELAAVLLLVAAAALVQQVLMVLVDQPVVQVLLRQYQVLQQLMLAAVVEQLDHQ